MSQSLVFMTDARGVSFTKNIHVHTHKSINVNVQKGGSVCMFNVNAAFIQQESRFPWLSRQ